MIYIYMVSRLQVYHHNSFTVVENYLGITSTSQASLQLQENVH